MIIHGQFYDGIVGKPDLDDALEHYGVLGMKWGVRKDPDRAYSKATKKSKKLFKKIEKANKKYLKKAKLGRLPITVISKRSVQNARSKVDLLTNKKKKWDEAIEKAFEGTKYAKKESAWDKLSKAEQAKILKEDFAKEAALYKKRAKENNKIYESRQKGSSNSDTTSQTKKTISSIESKVANAKKTGKYDMEFLERNLDTDQKTGESLQGKALDDAYRKYLKKKK